MGLEGGHKKTHCYRPLPCIALHPLPPEVGHKISLKRRPENKLTYFLASIGWSGSACTHALQHAGSIPLIMGQFGFSSAGCVHRCPFRRAADYDDTVKFSSHMRANTYTHTHRMVKFIFLSSVFYSPSAVRQQIAAKHTARMTGMNAVPSQPTCAPITAEALDEWMGGRNECMNKICFAVGRDSQLLRRASHRVRTVRGWWLAQDGTVRVRGSYARF